MMESKDVDQAHSSPAEASHISPTTDRSENGEHAEAKTEPDSVIVRRTVSEEEHDFLYQHTKRIRGDRVKESERAFQASPLPPTEAHTEQEVEDPEDAVVVIEYDRPLEGGIRGMTKIPRRFTNAEALESLGWRNFELKDGFFEVQFPLKKSQIDQVLERSKNPQEREEIREGDVRIRGTNLRPLPPRPFVEQEDEHREHSPIRRTSSPESLESRGRYREPGVKREYHRRISLSPSVTSEDSDDSREDYEAEGRYKPPEYKGESLKFDVKLSSLATDDKDNRTTNAHRPTKTTRTDKPETVSIETSRRYTDSVGETLVLTTGVKVSSSQLGHLRWVHLEHQQMSFESLQQLLLQTDDLNNDDVLIARQLIRRFQEGGEKPYVHGYYLQPGVLRCDSHDVGSGQKPDRACTFVCFPYFSFQSPPPVSSKTGAQTHSPRGLFQTLYYLESTKARDLEQVIRKLRPQKGDAMICVSQVWAIILGFDTLITYSAAPLATMRGDKIQITNPASTIRTAPSSLRITDPFERLFFFSLDQCKTWFELINLIHDQCLQNHGYSIDECNLYLKNGEKLKAPSWSAAVDAEKSPMVDIYVRFKDAQELESDEYERAETERERQRYRVEDKKGGKDVSVPTPRRTIRSPGISENYLEEEIRARGAADSEIRYKRDENDVKRELSRLMTMRRDTRDKESMALVRSHGRYPDRSLVRPRDRTLSPSPIVIRRKSFEKPRESIKRPRRTGTGDTTDRERIRGTEIIIRKDRYEREPTVIRERERNLSPMSIIKHRPGPRYQGGGLVLNASQRKENSEKDTCNLYYIPEEKKVQTTPAVKLTQDEDIQSERPTSRFQPVGASSSRRRNGSDMFEGSTESKDYAGKSSPHERGNQTTGSEPLDPSARRSWSRSSTREPPVVKPSVPPIFMWPVGRKNLANSSSNPNNSSVNGVIEQPSANASGIEDLLDRVHDHLLSDQGYEHSRLFLATGEATRQDPVFSSIERKLQELSEATSSTGNLSARPQATASTRTAEPNPPSTNRGNLHPSPPQLAEHEYLHFLKQFYEIAVELLDAFLPVNFPSPVAGRYYGAMKKIIEIVSDSHTQYFMREGKNLHPADETIVYTIFDVRVDAEYAQYHNVKAPQNPFSSCDECISDHIYKSKSDALEHLRRVHFTSADNLSTQELGHWIKKVDRMSVERCAAEQLHVLRRCCKHLYNLQTDSREIRDGVSTDDKVHQARYRLPKALVESFQRLVILLVYVAHVLEVISKNSERWLGPRWEAEDDREYVSLRDHMVFIGSGAEVNMEHGKLDLLQMIRLQDFTQSVSYEAVGPEYILSMVMFNLQRGVNCTNLVEVYKEWAERLAFQVSQRPRKRLLRDLQYLSEETIVLERTLMDQFNVLFAFSRCLNPDSFRVTTETRVSMYHIEHVLFMKTVDMNLKYRGDYGEIYRKVKRLVSQTKMSIEILDDDHGKAIFVFTVVTLIFLPMTFVTGLLGMNTVDIRNQNTTQWLFWAIALPITALVIVLALLVAYRHDEIKEWIDKKTKKKLEE